MLLVHLLACSGETFELSTERMCRYEEPADASSATAYGPTIQDYIDRGAEARVFEYPWRPDLNYLGLAPLLATVTITDVETEGLTQCFTADGSWSSAVTTAIVTLSVDEQGIFIDAVDQGRVWIQDDEIGFQIRATFSTPAEWEETVLDRLEAEQGTGPASAPATLLAGFGFGYEGSGGSWLTARTDEAYSLDEQTNMHFDAALAASEEVHQR